MSKENEFEFKGYWGAEILRPYVEYSKRGVHYCIYCESVADTREHVPSKTFLDKPLPSDLPTLPACKRCNNGFSSDELYTNTYIECAKTVAENQSLSATEIQPDDRREVREAKTSVLTAFQKGVFYEDEHIKRIIKKLAIGHIVYELFECYNIESFPVSDISISYMFKCSVDEDLWSSLETVELLDDEVLPEIGSRMFRNIIIMNLPLKAINDDKSVEKNLLFMDWSEIQNGVYRYITFYRNNKIIVKMMIRDFMYAKIVVSK